MSQEYCKKHPRYVTTPFCPDCQTELERMRADPVLFVETVGWHPEPGYIPDWQKRLMAELCGPMGRVVS